MIRLFSLILLVLCSSIAHSKTLLVLGDSLSAGYNMPIEQAWPSLLGNALANHNKTIEIVNGSVSGDTTGNGLSRLPLLLEEHQPNYVLIELGANDGLRGFPPNLISNTLTELIKITKDAGAQPILMQIRIPPNYGKRYSDAFFQIYPNLAEQENIPLLPFFLEQVVIKPEWMMEDGLHPKPVAQPWIAEFVAEKISVHL
ncbi:multifunctional acyl-CoA thioesterase I/protease I/lysophospholipase L1 [Vibrio genomosp. F10]|uniref:Arylesterase n=1 Tax=Vibrio genomosp. F10 str. ZF-129 TaxID=1187848 RepID=A0A1E5BBC4_9VIBR|nr:multifunctional acyl-CoA thioesterase I/protease I/lysophospholipase L1 [Vibrio genomosp. F10]OEE31316.1 arylesterase [Vibrio genomosp. F10 str. ZF-129]OEE96517.1 arylesterase [Vibrio genomosp. F10 str. 9ZC157]OEF06734.1 arylesterase [Vibrio genomosp. F10 str. 9ZD137]OEF10635.1 arylesterase [Vibrio genomosp. F10 str. 9ZB36]